METELVDKAGKSKAFIKFLSFSVILFENFVLLVVGICTNKKLLHNNQIKL